MQFLGGVFDEILHKYLISKPMGNHLEVTIFCKIKIVILRGDRSSKSRKKTSFQGTSSMIPYRSKDVNL